MSTFSSLKTKYGDFLVPDWEIKTGGTVLSTDTCALYEILTENSAGTAAAACRFTLGALYNPESREFSSAVLGAIKPGAKAEISLGYADGGVSKVFSGYISELQVNYSADEITLSGFCLDGRALMKGGSAYKAVKDKKIDDAVKAVLGKYSSVITSTDITLAAWEENCNITQAGDDLSYVAQAAESRGSYFFIDCGKARIDDGKTDVCAEFTWEDCEARINVKYLDTGYKAGGYDPAQMTPFTKTAKTKAAATQSTLMTTEKVILTPPYLSADSAESYMKALVKAAERSAVFGRLYCEGLPDVKIGKRVKIKKMPLGTAGVGEEFTVVSVKHSLTADEGFTTEIGIEGV